MSVGRLAATSAALAVVVALSGCSGFAVRSPVETGLEVDSRVQPRVRVVYPGPAPGATRDAVVAGFLRAGGATDGAYDRAREFLTAGAAAAWRPDEGIVVLREGTTPAVTSVDSDTVVVSSPMAARITAEGRYLPATAGEEARMRLDMVQVDGQWRIAALPEEFGRWLPALELPRLVEPYAVYFVAGDRRTLVPDMRWFPLDRLPSRLARAQLSPVPEHLLGTVTSAVPVGTRLAGDTVAVEAGVASVNLVGSQIPTNTGLRAELFAQMVATLTQVPSVSGLRVLADGLPVAAQGSPDIVTRPADVGFVTIPPAPTAYPVIRRGEVVSVFSPGAKEGAPPTGQLGGFTYPAIAQTHRRLALSADGSEIAAIDLAGVRLRRWAGGRAVDLAPFASSMSGPRYDRRRVLWVAGVSAKDQVTRVFVMSQDDRQQRPAALDVPWIADRLVSEVAVSPEGDLLAVLSTDSTGRGSRIDVTGVLRDPSGLPTALGGRLTLAPTVEDARGLTWVTETSLATVGGKAAKDRRPTIIEIAGVVRPLPVVAGAVTVASLGDERSVLVTNASGEIVQRTGAQWVTAGQGELITPAG